MPAAARGDGTEDVAILHSTCQPMTQTNECSSDVFVNNIGVVRKGDKVMPHTYNPPQCPLHDPGLSSYSSSVFINGKNAGRLGDKYACNAKIITGSDNVFIG